MEAYEYCVRHFQLMSEVVTQLASASIVLREEHFDYYIFGSWWFTFEKAGQIYRLAFDGRDKHASLARATKTESIFVRDWTYVAHSNLPWENNLNGEDYLKVYTTQLCAFVEQNSEG